jgi:hypothetical protein
MKSKVRVWFRFLHLILVLFVFAAAAKGEVIVYKGTARTGLSATTGFSKIPRLYLVVDLPSKTSYITFFYKLNGAKDSLSIPFDHTRYNSQALTADKRIGTFTSAIDLDFGASGFSAAMLYLRGRETALLLSNAGGPATGNFPKTLSGTLRQAQFAGGIATNFEFNVTLAFDPIHTQVANNGFKDGLATTTDIQSELIALGF